MNLSDGERELLCFDDAEADDREALDQFLSELDATEVGIVLDTVAAS